MFRNLVVLVVLCLSACAPADKPNFHSTDITGAQYGQNAHWLDHSGKPRTLADYKGKVVALFFGFTQCPDVCPATLTQLKEVKKQLGSDGEKFQVLLMTLDPERDTTTLLSQYVPAFDPSFIGLRASPQNTPQIISEFKAFAQKVNNESGGSYSFDHTAGIYIYDPAGRLRLFVRQGEKSENIAKDIKSLLAESSKA